MKSKNAINLLEIVDRALRDKISKQYILARDKKSFVETTKAKIEALEEIRREVNSIQASLSTHKKFKIKEVFPHSQEEIK